MGLAATKLHPPAPPTHLVRRSRLDALLDESMLHRVRLILASAPAGSGKSTLLSSWLAGRNESVAWLQVEDSDSDPARFWLYLVECIGEPHPPLADELRPIVVGSNGDDLVVVAALVNALRNLTSPLIILIDDYHLIESASVHRGVERLVQLCPDNVTLVISTRVDPPFRLGRLRVGKRISEIRATDLRFDADEASGLLGAAGRSLSPTRIAQLCGRTEGWAAGLVLAGLSLQRADDPNRFIDDFRGDDQLVVEYLTEELLDGVAEDDRRRLLQTSILDQLSGTLVDALTGTSGGAEWLRETSAVNQLLIGLDRSGEWFRYHHLLRDLLRLEAGREFPHVIADLHRRAASWFEDHGDDRQAITHQLAAGESIEAVRLMRTLGPRLLGEGQIDTLRGLLDQLDDVAETSTICAVLQSWCHFIGGRHSVAERWLATALAAAPAGFDQSLVVALRINLALARGDVATALADARAMTATDQLVSHPSDLAVATGAAYAWAGHADEARTTLMVAEQRAADDRSSSARLLATVYRAIVEFDDAPAAVAHAAAIASLELAERSGLGSYHGVAPAYAIRARTGDDPARAHADAATAVELVRRASTDLALGYVLAMCGDTLVGLNDDNGARLLAEARAVLNRCTDPGIAGSYLARAEARHGTRVPVMSRAAALVEQLTERELAVLQFLPTPLSQRDISAELYVSLNTVKTHCQAIYRKLAVGDRKAAVQAARDLGLL